MKVTAKRIGPESWKIISDEGINLNISAHYPLSSLFDAIRYWADQQEGEGRKWSKLEVTFSEEGQETSKLGSKESSYNPIFREGATKGNTKSRPNQERPSCPPSPQKSTTPRLELNGKGLIDNLTTDHSKNLC